MSFYLSSSPHIRSGETTPRLMLSVILALLPAGAWGIWQFGAPAAAVILCSVISCLFIEYVAQRFVFQKPPRFRDGSAALTGLLLAYCLPPGIPLWQVVIGAFFAIFIAKECFGGLGQNIFNPALIGRAALLASFPVTMTSWQLDGVTTASPLGLLRARLGRPAPGYLDLFLGDIPGSIGEVSKLLLLLGALFLLWRGIIALHTPLSFIAVVAALAPLFGRDPLAEVLSGGIILGAFFMATDYATTPLFPPGKILFGAGCGLLTVLIRNLGAYPEGVCYSILIMNILVPLIDRFTTPHLFGGRSA